MHVGQNNRLCNMKYVQTQTLAHTPLRIPHKRLSHSVSICTEIKSHYSDKLLARLITGWQTCIWPAAASIFCLDCRVEEEEVETARLCLSHRTSSHIQESCKINTHAHLWSWGSYLPNSSTSFEVYTWMPECFIFSEATSLL